MLQLNEIQLFKGDPTNIWGKQIAPPENIITMEVKEIMNGDLTLTMTCAASDNNVKNLVIGNIIKCYKDILKQTQFSFEIYDVKYSIDHRITVKAEHLSARLRYIYVEPIYLWSFSDLSTILSGEYTSSLGRSDLLINHTGRSPITIDVPQSNAWDTRDDKEFTDSVKSITDIMRGTSGSVLDIVGQGRWVYTNDTTLTFDAEESWKTVYGPTIKPIRYSNDMSDFKREIDMDNAKSNQVLFWKKEVDGKVEQVWAYQKKTSDVYPMQAAQLRDLSSAFETKPTKAQLLAAAPSLSTSPEVTTNCSVANYEGYATCGRKILVIFPEFGVEEEMRVTETVYNVLNGKYKSIKLGTLKKTLSKTIAEITSKTGVAVY